MARKDGGPTVNKRPAAGTKTGRVWDTADAITREKRRAATCREVRERYVAEGATEVLRTHSTRIGRRPTAAASRAARRTRRTRPATSTRGRCEWRPTAAC